MANKKISRTDYEGAKKLILDFKNQEFTKEYKDGFPCIRCGNKLEILYPEHVSGKAEQEMWKNGIVDKISAGYGSEFDGNMYLFGLCDECIKFLIKTGKIKYAGNYMGLY